LKAIPDALNRKQMMFAYHVEQDLNSDPSRENEYQAESLEAWIRSLYSVSGSWLR
jgi:hypothetical protein